MASPGSTPGGVKASSSETFDRGVDVSRSTGGRDWGGATFGDPRTPEKAQRRLGGLTKKKKKKKKKLINTLRPLAEVATMKNTRRSANCTESVAAIPSPLAMAISLTYLFIF